MSEPRCDTCKWIRQTSAFTPFICAIPVPYWVKGSAILQERVINSLTKDCHTYEKATP